MIADTSAWIEMLRNTGSDVDKRFQQALLRRERIFLPDVIYQEVLQGATDARQFMRLQAQLDRLPAFVAQDNRELARQAALLYARCRWRGLTIRSPNDCLIAACAIESGEPLLHADRDFDAIASIDPRLQTA